jgi:hypothetical protein
MARGAGAVARRGLGDGAGKAVEHVVRGATTDLGCELGDNAERLTRQHGSRIAGTLADYAQDAADAVAIAAGTVSEVYSSTMKKLTRLFG